MLLRHNVPFGTGHRAPRTGARHIAVVHCSAAPKQVLASTPASTASRLTAPGLKAEPWTGSPQQLQALQKLQQRFAANECPDEATLKWYLRDRYFDVHEAEEKLRKMLKWKKSFQPQATTHEKVKRELSTGKAYVHTVPDIYGRPVVIIKTKLHVTGQFPFDDSKRLACYLIDQAIAQIPPGGEQIVGVFDLRGFQVPKNADFQFAAFMVEAFFEYYPRRVGQVLFVDAPWVFTPVYEVIKPLLRKYSALVRFLSSDELRREFFKPTTVPPDFK